VFTYIALGVVVHVVHLGFLILKVVMVDFKFAQNFYFLVIKGRVNSI
jgi:hypothetical protein